MHPTARANWHYRRIDGSRASLPHRMDETALHLPRIDDWKILPSKVRRHGFLLDRRSQCKEESCPEG
jgi:hypothetical protein